MSQSTHHVPAGDVKRYADLQHWIGSGYRNGRPLEEDDYDRLEDERDALVQKHGPAIRQKATASQGGPRESYTPPSGAGPRKHAKSSGTRSQSRGGTHTPSRAPKPAGGRGTGTRRAPARVARGDGGRRQSSTNVTIVDQAAGAATQAASTGYTIATGTTAGGMIVDFLVGGVGLCVLYLMLTKSAAVSGLIGGVSTTVKAVISPNVDPLNPGAAKK